MQRVGLTTRLWLALLLVAASEGQATIVSMFNIATGLLPRHMQWQLGILALDPRTGQARGLTAKQLYNMAERISKHLDVDPARTDLDAAKRAARVLMMNAIKDALVFATHVLPHDWTSYAVDETGVWAWVKGKRKPEDLPEVHPGDDVAVLTAETRSLDERTRLDPPISDDAEPTVEDQDQHEAAARPADQSEPEPADEPTPDKGTGKRAPMTCWLANWGVKTHKGGKKSAFFGYSMHVLIRVPDLIKGKGKPTRTNSISEPLLIEQFELTNASTDIVDITLAMITKTLRRGHRMVDLIGDRHYSYKRFERWVSQLWALGVRQVLDLRKDDHGAVDYNGAQMIAGTPHCGVPEPLVTIERPGLGASSADKDEFRRLIDERSRYAMVRKQTAWQNGDGKTRWKCAAADGRVGCPRLKGTVETAVAFGQPIVTPPESQTPWCQGGVATIQPGEYMKLHQQEYWGQDAWEKSWARRTYVESANGNMKNHHTGNIHRGFMCFTGMPLVTLAITAAAVAYNLGELENWYQRATNSDKSDRPTRLLELYREHPLHQRTQWQDGFTMLTKAQALSLDQRRSRTLDEDKQGLPQLPAAA